MSDSGTPWTIAHQAPLYIEFFRQDYWSELPVPSPGDLPDPGIESSSPALQADSLPTEPPGKPKDFLDMDQKHNPQKSKLNFIKIKNLCSLKDTVKKMKR